MSYQMQSMKDLGNLTYASISWATGTASMALVAAPSSGKLIELRWIYAYQSAFGSLTLTPTTAAATSIWYWPGANGNPVAEEAVIQFPDGSAVNAFSTNGGGNGVMHVYYRVVPNTGGASGSY